MELRIGNGYDVHALAQGLPMWLGGVRIPSETGFVAHSDGDVAIHALCDALLGALALGDIGHLFPDTSDEWKGIDSKILLGKVVAVIQERGLGNFSAYSRRFHRCRLRQSHHHRTARIRGPRRRM